MKNINLYFPIALFTMLMSFKMTSAQTKLGIRAGFNMASASIENEDGSESSTQSIPGIHIDLVYKRSADRGNLLVGAGLYAGYGINGKWETETDVVIGDIRIETGGMLFSKTM